MATIDLRDGSSDSQGQTSRFSVGNRLQWRGRIVEVMEVIPLTPDHTQVVLKPCDRDGLPMSVPISDLDDAAEA